MADGDDDSLRYLFQGSGANIAFTDSGPVFQVFKRDAVEATTDASADNLLPGMDPDEGSVTTSTQFSVSFDGANIVAPVGLVASESTFHYMLGDESRWRSDVVGYETVAYEGLYEGIDLHTWGRRNSLKYEFRVAPGQDYRAIQVSYEGIEGLYVDETGAMHVQTELGELTDDVPYIYQVIDGLEVEV